jgi:hypothetical protein
LGATDSPDVIGSKWWIAFRCDPGILRNSIGAVRLFRVTSENGELYNFELPNGETSTLRKEWLQKAIEDNRVDSSQPAEGTQWCIRKPDTYSRYHIG